MEQVRVHYLPRPGQGQWIDEYTTVTDGPRAGQVVAYNGIQLVELDSITQSDQTEDQDGQ